ncbi:hypothetical protein EHEL_090930 [Encephalitozoon hellem ATCC 50504]|uniref:Uncharacterized protein n=1 Tax=Encephalitozoon hellem TaxID=27973 RepID=A0A9Q9F8T0_ENCHE|nr:uncharacterized protein EHEL_090930 [Encephalitozoon hellem ATCC 50504]AFM98988.1 hypothetical protein EHEL_090930 [Encephalitozoon hellem ATCC 50504]UTX44004.1 hypothetical protein GPU96_09g17840 [Encephalitozoon hellem]WEL39489.1 hypothetical protein PFJ87_09g01170 [Encephalitozoon hellem]|eukprot:XP_003887969.1 hypothetical protein EHEL_090930 [Encephalitozoon hellem ATCC 50504]
MFKITGAKRTDKGFLDKIQGISRNSSIDEVVGRLRRLRIFSAIAETDDGLSVTEEKRSIRFTGDTTGRVPKGYLKIKLPNLFRRAENLEVSVSTSRDMSLRFTKPILRKSLSFLSIFGARDVMKSPHEEYPHTRVSLEVEMEKQKICAGKERIGYLDQAFLEIKKKLGAIDVRSKIGIFDSRSSRLFLKTQAEIVLGKSFARSLFTDMHLSTGLILGEPHIAERYYLGENIRGYKGMSISPSNCGLKIGGNSFLEASHRMGVCRWEAKGFVFWSLGYVSEKRSIVNGLRSITKSRSYKDDECLGASVGLGASVPVMRSKDGPVVTVSFAIPLTNNRQVQRLQFGFDMDF